MDCLWYSEFGYFLDTTFNFKNPSKTYWKRGKIRKLPIQWLLAVNVFLRDSTSRLIMYPYQTFANSDEIAIFAVN